MRGFGEWLILGSSKVETRSVSSNDTDVLDQFSWINLRFLGLCGVFWGKVGLWGLRYGIPLGGSRSLRVGFT